MERIRITRLGAKGDGVADNGVFASGALPGELIEGEIAASRIIDPRIIEPSPDRRPPPCPHYGACGGCALQHASDDLVAHWKREQIATALSARGIEDIDIRPTATSPTHSRRRAVFSARRTKKSAIAGFHARRASDIVDVKTCPVLAPPLLAVLPAIREAARLGGSRKGEIRATATLTETGVDLAVDEAKPLAGEVLAAAATLAEVHGLARLTWNGDIIATRTLPRLTFGDGPASVTPPPGGFLQATSEGEAALLTAAREAVGGAKRIVDLFAGAGTFALPIAAKAAVHAVEGDSALTGALLAAAQSAPGLKPVTTETRDLFRRPLLAHELKGYDAAIIDPPRAGAAAQSDLLGAAGPPIIASISCDPATFARDARTLIDGGYRLEWVLPVDQFRWSPHVEIAAKFQRR